MDARERQEASRTFSDQLRAKLAESRRGLTAEDLKGGTGGEQDTAPGGQNEPREDEEGGRS